MQCFLHEDDCWISPHAAVASPDPGQVRVAVTPLTYHAEGQQHAKWCWSKGDSSVPIPLTTSLQAQTPRQTPQRDFLTIPVFPSWRHFSSPLRGQTSVPFPARRPLPTSQARHSATHMVLSPLPAPGWSLIIHPSSHMPACLQALTAGAACAAPYCQQTDSK